MKITYFLNAMYFGSGLAGLTSGRIDIHDHSQFGQEIDVPPISDDSWKHFGAWLNTLETDEVWSLEQIITAFEAETGNKIKWKNR